MEVKEDEGLSERLKWKCTVNIGASTCSKQKCVVKLGAKSLLKWKYIYFVNLVVQG